MFSLWLANCHFARDKSDNQNGQFYMALKNLPPIQFARDRPHSAVGQSHGEERPTFGIDTRHNKD